MTYNGSEAFRSGRHLGYFSLASALLLFKVYCLNVVHGCCFGKPNVISRSGTSVHNIVLIAYCIYDFPIRVVCATNPNSYFMVEELPGILFNYTVLQVPRLRKNPTLKLI